MLKMIERATRQPITPIALPSSEEVANLRVAQFKRLVVDTLGSQDLGFFMNVVNSLVEENEIDVHEVAAGLAYLAQRERPLQIEESGRGWEVATTPTTTGGRPPRDEHFTTGVARERPQRPNRDEILQRRRAFADGALVRYRIEVGRNQGASPKEIVGAIANEGGIEGKYIGQIHLFNDFSTVELPANLPSDLLDTLKRTRVRQLPLNIRALTDAEAVAVPERRRPPREDGPRREDALRRSEAPRRDDAPRQYGDERRPPRSYGADSGKPAWGDKGAGQGKPGGYGKPGGGYGKPPGPRRDEHKPYPQRHDDRAGNAPFSAHKPKRPKDA
jgi:ATP-dependent RNA helicase DeaD